MKISDQNLKEVCKIGQGKDCCRYVTVGPKGFECAKNTGLLRCILNTKVERNMMVAQGDNCDGIKEVAQ